MPDMRVKGGRGGEGPVQELAPAPAGPAVDDRVHARRPDIAEHGPDPGTGEDRECAVKSEPRAPIMNLARCGSPPRSMIRLRACWAVHSPVGSEVIPRILMRLLACSITART